MPARWVFLVLLFLGVVASASGLAVGAPPTFHIPRASPAGNQAEAIAAGDVDGDHDIDVAIANTADATISILHNDGAGNLTVGFTDRVGQRPQHLLLADIDRDGDPDLVVANQNSANISVLLNRGGGAFSARVNYAAGANPQFLAAGDMDGDTDLDLAVANGGAGTVSVMRNVGGTAFQIANIIYIDGDIGAVAIGDMDGDGDADVVATNRYLGRVVITSNFGGWAFATPQAFKTAAQVVGVALADRDDDGDLDVMTAHAEERALAVLTNAGDGTLVRTSFYATGNTVASARTLECGDLDADGDTDVVVVNGPSSGSTLSLLFNTGAGDFGLPLNLQASHDGRNALPLYDAVIATIDSQPGADIAVVGHVAAPGFSGVAVVCSDPQHRAFEAPRTLPSGKNPVALAVADMDADAWPDLAVVDRANGVIALHWNTGDGSFTAPALEEAGIQPAAIATADFDADGDIDLATADVDPSTDDITLHWNDGAGNFPDTVVFPEAGPGQAGTRQLLAADVDGDADLDLVAADSVASCIRVFMNRGGKAFGQPVAYAGITQPSDVHSGDLDGDGDPDLVVASAGVNATLLWNAGDGTFPLQSLLALGAGQVSQAIADLDGDGDLDIVSVLRGIGVAGVSSNTGGGTFGPVVLVTVGDAMGPSSLLATDADNDGDVDLLFANRATGSVTLLENEGAGAFALARYFAAGSRPCALAGVDVDGDGDEDLAVANAGASGVSILLNTTRSVPVILAALEASETARGTVLLTWRLGEGVQVQGFRVERQERATAAIVTTPMLPATVRTYEDDGARPGVTYRYVLVAQNGRGAVVRSAGVEFTRGGTALQLLSAVPNPCRGGTTIRFGVPEAMVVEVALFDVRGKRVAQLVDAVVPRGMHALPWTGRDAAGTPVAPGVYLCRLRAGAAVVVEKIVVAPQSPQR